MSWPIYSSHIHVAETVSASCIEHGIQNLSSPVCGDCRGGQGGCGELSGGLGGELWSMQQLHITVPKLQPKYSCSNSYYCSTTLAKLLQSVCMVHTCMQTVKCMRAQHWLKGALYRTIVLLYCTKGAQKWDNEEWSGHMTGTGVHIVTLHLYVHGPLMGPVN